MLNNELKSSLLFFLKFFLIGVKFLDYLFRKIIAIGSLEVLENDGKPKIPGGLILQYGVRDKQPKGQLSLLDLSIQPRWGNGSFCIVAEIHQNNPT